MTHVLTPPSRTNDPYIAPIANPSYDRHFSVRRVFGTPHDRGESTNRATTIASETGHLETAVAVSFHTLGRAIYANSH